MRARHDAFAMVRTLADRISCNSIRYEICFFNLKGILTKAHPVTGKVICPKIDV